MILNHHYISICILWFKRIIGAGLFSKDYACVEIEVWRLTIGCDTNEIDNLKWSS